MHGTTDVISAIGLSVVAGGLLGLVARVLHQPLILGYVIGGILLGHHLGFGIITDEAAIEAISEIGLILLLYIIGLEISVPKLLRMGRTVLICGVAQFLGCLVLGFAFSRATAFEAGGGFDAVYLGVTLALSSTMIVVKLLYDKFETETVAGRITIGILVLQDVWAIVFLALQPNLSSPKLTVILRSFGMGALLLVGAFWLSGTVLSRLFARISKTPELVLILSIAWCFLVATGASVIGLSKEMGALVAGMSVAAFPYNIDVVAKLIGIRDFFVTLFFVSLGMKIHRPDPGLVGWAAAAVGFVLLSRILTVWPVLRLMGMGNRLGLVVSLNLAQVSEFSLVIAALGMGYNHLDPRTNDLVLMTMLASAVLSTYVILYNQYLAGWLERGLEAMGLKSGGELPLEEAGRGVAGKEIALLGYFREAQALISVLNADAPELKRKLLVVDYNAKVLKQLQQEGLTAVYGDIANVDTLLQAGVGGCRLIICSLSDTFLKGTDTLSLVRSLRKNCPHARIVALGETAKQAEELLRAGAQMVIHPGMLVGREFLQAIRSLG